MQGALTTFWPLLGAIALFLAGFCLGLMAAKWVIVLASSSMVQSRRVIEGAQAREVKRSPAYNGDEKAADYEDEIAPRAKRTFQIPRR